jgi:hypothetical protein
VMISVCARVDEVVNQMYLYSRTIIELSVIRGVCRLVVKKAEGVVNLLAIICEFRKDTVLVLPVKVQYLYF